MNRSDLPPSDCFLTQANPPLSLADLPAAPEKYSCSPSGFTLIEVLVSMVLVSMVTLIMAVSLRINLQAWERGVQEGEKLHVKVVLPALMERQLRSLVTTASFAGWAGFSSNLGRGEKLKFIKNDNLFSFYTLYTPQGTPAQGLIRVAYTYSPDRSGFTKNNGYSGCRRGQTILKSCCRQSFWGFVRH